MITLPPQNSPVHDKLDQQATETVSRLMRTEWYLPLVALAKAVNSPLVRYGTTVQRGLLNASAVQSGTLFLETDTQLIYQARIVNNMPAWVLLDIVTGASNLVNSGALVMVGANPGTLDESAATDDGTVILIVGRLLDSDATIRSTGVQDPVDGAGVEVKCDTGVGQVHAYDRDAPGWLPLELGGDTITLIPDSGTTENRGDFDITGGGVLQVAGTQVVGPRGAAITGTVGPTGAAPAAYNQVFEQTLATAINNLITRVSEIEARMVAHGLIA